MGSCPRSSHPQGGPMNTRIRAVSLASVLVASSLAAFGQGKACALATPAELEALGGKATMTAGTMGTVETCNGTAGAANVLILSLIHISEPTRLLSISY